jgi:Bacterial PH domain
MSDFDFERTDGLPGPLPEGERILWQGKPQWLSLAVHAFHVRKIAIYFAGLAVAQAIFRWADGGSLSQQGAALLWLVPMGLAAVAILAGLAWLSARTTVYTLTTRRIVLKVGMALSVSINIPFKQIDGASLGLTGSGHGDLCFRPARGNRLAYLLLWPHAKPWHFARPEPAFRAIANVDAVADLAARALGSAPVMAAQPERRREAVLAAAE